MHFRIIEINLRINLNKYETYEQLISLNYYSSKTFIFYDTMILLFYITLGINYI